MNSKRTRLTIKSVQADTCEVAVALSNILNSCLLRNCGGKSFFSFIDYAKIEEWLVFVFIFSEVENYIVFPFVEVLFA